MLRVPGLEQILKQVPEIPTDESELKIGVHHAVRTWDGEVKPSLMYGLAGTLPFVVAISSQDRRRGRSRVLTRGTCSCPFLAGPGRRLE